MIDLVRTAELPLQEVVDLVEGDAVLWLWSVGRCTCGSKEGDFSARVQSPDYIAPVQGLDILRGKIVTVQEGRGCDVFAHATTAAGALAKAYGIAQGLAG